MYIYVLLLSIGLVGIALLGLGVQTFFTKKGKFPEHRVGHNKEMRKRKIYCAKTMQKIEDKKIKEALQKKGLCNGCSCVEEK